MATQLRKKTMPQDVEKFLYTILKQLDLRCIDWNLVADTLGITNGHAARMCYSRFKALMEGSVPTPRKAGGFRADTSRSKGKSAHHGKGNLDQQGTKNKKGDIPSIKMDKGADVILIKDEPRESSGFPGGYGLGNPSAYQIAGHKRTVGETDEDAEDEVPLATRMRVKPEPIDGQGFTPSSYMAMSPAPLAPMFPGKPMEQTQHIPMNSERFYVGQPTFKIEGSENIPHLKYESFSGQ